MRLSIFCLGVSLPATFGAPETSSIHSGALKRAADTPAGCRSLAGDSSWPAPDVWTKELPGVVPRGPANNKNQKHPDYRLSVKNAKDVQNALAFATKYNVRVSIINSGHDYMGRNDAPTGLWIDVSQLKGVRVDSSFTPTMEGAPSPEATVNVLPAQKNPGAVTFGAAVNTWALNKAIKPSKLFTLGAAHGK